MHNAISHIVVVGAAKSIDGASRSPATVAPQNNKPTFGLSVYRRRGRPPSAHTGPRFSPLGPWPPISTRPERRQCRQAICHIKYWRSVSNLREKRRDATLLSGMHGRRWSAVRWGMAAARCAFLVSQGTNTDDISAAAARLIRLTPYVRSTNFHNMSTSSVLDSSDTVTLRMYLYNIMAVIC